MTGDEGYSFGAMCVSIRVGGRMQGGRVQLQVLVSLCVAVPWLSKNPSKVADRAVCPGSAPSAWEGIGRASEPCTVRGGM